MSSSFSPFPSLTPTVLFLERLTKDVSMMSPMPATLVMVDASAPKRVASHLISAAPCATRAERALLPRPKPSTIPAAMATTFLSAPQISTPTTSLVVLTLRFGLANMCWTAFAWFSSSDAAIRFVGRPSITSLAKLGPERATSGWSRPRAACKTSCIVMPEPTSSPLLTEITVTLLGMCAFTSLRKALLDWTGMACTMYCAPPTASCASKVAVTFGGRAYSER
mmetsp:Transcript_3990/g.10191  ORF Transcript_3990/g.10191 Transcript_3990/m.10191 type:complete len:223 (+) Transcript_3990:1121-1789(+)